jgi:hypothetical protein
MKNMRNNFILDCKTNRAKKGILSLRFYIHDLLIKKITE